MTKKNYIVDLTSQLIENLNAKSRTTIKVNKLLNKDCKLVKINKEEKKTLCKRLAIYIKAVKATSKHHVSCFNRIEEN